MFASAAYLFSCVCVCAVAWVCKRGVTDQCRRQAGGDWEGTGQRRCSQTCQQHERFRACRQAWRSTWQCCQQCAGATPMLQSEQQLCQVCLFSQPTTVRQRGLSSATPSVYQQGTQPPAPVTVTACACTCVHHTTSTVLLAVIALSTRPTPCVSCTPLDTPSLPPVPGSCSRRCRHCRQSPCY